MAFCFSYNVITNNVTLQINGKTVFSDIGRHNTSDDRIMFEKPIQVGGNLTSPFIGKLTDVNVWNGSIYDVEMSDFASCAFANIYASNQSMPLQWSNIRVDLKNNTKKKFNVTLDWICSDFTSTKTILFPKPATFEQAFKIIEQLNGEMYLPTNRDEFTKAFTFDSSKLKSACLNAMWLPIVRSETNYTDWLKRSNLTEQVTYLKWTTGQPNGYPDQNCISVEPSGYSDADCNGKRCFLGKFKRSPVFHVRGKTVIDPATDNLYSFNFDSIAQNKYKFQGFSGLSDIIGDFYFEDWSMKTYNITTGVSKVIGYLEVENFLYVVSEFPFGTTSWDLYTQELSLMKISKVNIIE